MMRNDNLPPHSALHKHKDQKTDVPTPEFGGKPKILVIVGPTASGKSDLAVKLAKKYNGEIISADSRQVYRGMDIGTGKVKRQKTKGKSSEYYSGGIKHHLLDVASPKRQFTVAQYQKLGQAAIKKILRKGKLPIIVGGTGFYIDALVYDQQLPKVKPNPKLRTKLEKQTTEQLFKQLRRLDSQRAKTIDRHNKRRLVRALEIVITTGKPVPKLVLNNKYQVLSIGIKIPDITLKKRIHNRLIKRIRAGMIAEVKKLKANGLSWERLDNFGLEYRWISGYLREFDNDQAFTKRRSSFNATSQKEAKKEMITTLEKAIWHYAKRQMTWFTQPHFGIKNNIKWISTVSQAENEINKLIK